MKKIKLHIAKDRAQLLEKDADPEPKDVEIIELKAQKMRDLYDALGKLMLEGEVVLLKKGAFLQVPEDAEEDLEYWVLPRDAKKDWIK